MLLIGPLRHSCRPAAASKIIAGVLKTADPRTLILAPLAGERDLLAAAFGRSHPIEPVGGLRIPCGSSAPGARS